MIEGRILYRVPEVATMLGLSRAKVNQLIAKGTIPSIKIDGSRRIPADDLSRFIASLRQIQHETSLPQASSGVNGGHG